MSGRGMEPEEALKRAQEWATRECNPEADIEAI